MAIPLAYNLRNLVVRKTSTLMTALGIALTVAILLAVLALVNGLQNTLGTSGDPLRIIVLRKGAESELTSLFVRTQLQDLKFKQGIATGSDGQPLVSMEVITVINLANVDNANGVNVTVRGLPPAGIEMRKNVHIVSGRWFNPGRREVVVGKSVASRFPDAHLGGKVRFGRGDWDIVGVMDADGGAQNSEIWGDLNQISSDYNRQNGLSSVLVRAVNAAAIPALINSINDDRQLNVSAMPEQQYYASQTSSGMPIEFLGILVAVIMAVGSSFAAMNTMYAAVARRSREIGTLRVLGFSRGSILLSFLIEALLLSVAGGALGCLITLPLNFVTTGIGSFTSFSEIAFNFRVGFAAMATGMIFATFVGATGGLFPARNAAKKEILGALREI